MSLLISEDFYSVQCEGISTGYPSYFVRLSNCNLHCGSQPSEVNEIRKAGNVTPGDFQGIQHKQGTATWTCDTIPVWVKGVERDNQYLIDRWKEQEIYEDIKKGTIHIIWTGGEPTLPKHQEAIINFIKFFKQLDSSINKEIIGVSTDKTKLFQEIETNGTIYINDPLFYHLDQINCSPKLSNSGNPFMLRYNEKALRRIMEHPNYQFKFVISEEKDLKEIFDQYINKLNIPLNRVVCMPGLDSRENFHERTRFVLEMVKKYKFIGLTRLHVSAWDKTTGV